MERIIRNKKYSVIEDYGETLNSINLEDIVTEYYDSFDYIVGDWAYGKVRLKGFNRHNNKCTKNYNDYNYVKDYLTKSCAYGCKYFILEKIIEKSE